MQQHTLSSVVHSSVGNREVWQQHAAACCRVHGDVSSEGCMLQLLNQMSTMPLPQGQAACCGAHFTSTQQLWRCCMTMNR